jgi:hypothetical protein
VQLRKHLRSNLRGKNSTVVAAVAKQMYSSYLVDAHTVSAKEELMRWMLVGMALSPGLLVSIMFVNKNILILDCGIASTASCIQQPFF